jgi:hypothetical protein
MTLHKTLAATVIASALLLIPTAASAGDAGAAPAKTTQSQCATSVEKSAKGKTTAAEKSAKGKTTAAEKSAKGKTTAAEKSAKGKTTAAEKSAKGKTTAAAAKTAGCPS